MNKERVGDLLLSAGMVTKEDLNAALKIQAEKKGKRIGDILIEMGILTREKLFNFLGVQMGIPFVDLGVTPPDPSSVKLLPPGLAEKYKAIPFKKEGNQLNVAMADPLDVIAMDSISLATNLPVKPFAANADDINTAIGRYYSEEETAARSSAGRTYDPFAAQSEMAVIKPSAGAPAEKPEGSLEHLISKAHKLGASELYAESAGSQVLVRVSVDGFISELTSLPRASLQSLVSRARVLAGLDMGERMLWQRGRFQGEINRLVLSLRVDIFPTSQGERLVIRFLESPQKFQDLAALGMDAQTTASLHSALKARHGLLLVSSPPGHGSSTTLDLLARAMMTEQAEAFYVAESISPILPAKGMNHLILPSRDEVLARKMLKSLVRQHPRFLFVDELLELDALAFAVDLVLSGTFVVGTLAAANAASALFLVLQRKQETSSLLRGILSQTLLRKLCEKCKKPVNPKEPDGACLSRGCERCNKSGFRGRVGVFTFQETSCLWQGSPEGAAGKLKPNMDLASLSREFQGSLKSPSQQAILSGITTQSEVDRVLAD